MPVPLLELFMQQQLQPPQSPYWRSGPTAPTSPYESTVPRFNRSIPQQDLPGATWLPPEPFPPRGVPYFPPLNGFTDEELSEPLTDPSFLRELFLGLQEKAQRTRGGINRNPLHPEFL